MTRRVEIIIKKEFAAAAFNEDDETVEHIAALVGTTKMTVCIVAILGPTRMTKLSWCT